RQLLAALAGDEVDGEAESRQEPPAESEVLVPDRIKSLLDQLDQLLVDRPDHSAVHDPERRTRQPLMVPRAPGGVGCTQEGLARAWRYSGAALGIAQREQQIGLLLGSGPAAQLHRLQRPLIQLRALLVSHERHRPGRGAD